MESELIELRTLACYGIEAFGVLVVIIGSCICSFVFIRSYRNFETGIAYANYRQDLGRSIILGLEQKTKQCILRLANQTKRFYEESLN